MRGLALLAVVLVLTPFVAADEIPACDTLDPREAHVCGVDWTPTQNGTIFDVTVYDANNETHGYVDWWQIETRDGEVIYRHDIPDANSTEPFSTRVTLNISDDLDEAVFRAHDTIYGYGGRVAIVGFIGTQKAVDQGSEPMDFSESTGQNTSTQDDGTQSESTEDTQGEDTGGLGDLLEGLLGGDDEETPPPQNQTDTGDSENETDTSFPDWVPTIISGDGTADSNPPLVQIGAVIVLLAVLGFFGRRLFMQYRANRS